MRDYRKLEVWRLARKLAVFAYHLTQDLPASETYGLTSQIRRSAVSVAANIAEGAGRGTDAEMLRFVRIALGSLNETETLVAIAQDLGFLRPAQAASFFDEATDLGVKLRNFAKRLESFVSSGSMQSMVVRELSEPYEAEFAVTPAAGDDR